MLNKVTFQATFIALCTMLSAGAYAIADTPKQVDIPAGELSVALLKLSKQYGADLVYRPEQVHGLRTHGAHGSLTTEQAATQLLQGTPLELRTDPSGAMLIAPTTSGIAEGANPPEGSNEARDPNNGSKEVGKNTSQDFRVAQLDQGKSTSDVPVDKSDEQEKNKKTEGLEEIIVTGTHIRGVEPSSPVEIITREDIERSGYTSVGDVMRSLPQNYNGGNSPQLVTGSAPGIDNGASFTGGSTPNLRGLGSGSTLTLVNGHRLADDTVNGAADISLIPLAAIERVEVVTDGASAAYGSDAVAGVVNIILRKDYNGSLTSVLGGGTAQGGGTEKQINQLLGKTWGSGGVLVDYEYDRSDPINSTQRSYTLEAGVPTTLYPESSRNSLFLTANQELGNRVSAFVDALYTYRISTNSISYAGEDYTANSELDVHQYSTAFGLDVLLPGDWKLRPTVDLSEQRSVDTGSSVPGGASPTLIFEGRTSSYEVVADGPMFTLPAGVVRGAVGGGYRLESFAYLQSGSTPEVDAEGGVSYAYAELQIPLLSPAMGTWIRKLDLMVSGREEHYSEFGGEGVPQLGLVYTPADSLKTRATWGKSFRAPTLFDQFAINAAEVLQIPNSRGTSSFALLETGGDANLRPETARTWTVGADYDSERVKGLHISATYYDISYIDRISRIPTFYSALTDPLFAPFVTLSPSAAQQQSVISAAGPNFFNTTTTPYSPSIVAALVNDELVNVARQDIKGVDLSANYKVPTYKGSLEIFANASYLDLRQQFVPGAPEVEISGQAFEPAKFRARGGATFGFGPLSATGIVNYTGGEVNSYVPDNTHIASWTTFDVQLGFRPQLGGVLSGFQAALSVQNLFDRDPPFVLFDQYVPGLHYDPTNASVLGRFISLRLSKEFK
jgi:iron complex outermembrane recepter protein